MYLLTDLKQPKTEGAERNRGWVTECEVEGLCNKSFIELWQKMLT